MMPMEKVEMMDAMTILAGIVDLKVDYSELNFPFIELIVLLLTSSFSLFHGTLHACYQMSG